MTILGLIVLIVLVGIFLGIVNRFIPMAGMIKSLLNMLVFILMVIYILQFFEIIQPPLLPIPNMFHF